ncbi:MAG: cytochrome ubiquinol oxidase subunit I, partial [Myxococcales bacterium]|nr:cytochrome ubiquinol oxidase subunit I [Myxococcales bacterium]
FTPAFPTQATHMALAAYSSVGFAVLGIHAYRLLRDPGSSFHRSALRVVLPVVLISAPLQVVSGDFSAKHIAAHQPAKLAAAEALFHTERGAPLLVGGIPDPEREEVSLALRLPRMLSVMAKGDPNAEVSGLDRVPREDWAPVTFTHLSFQVMVASGFAMLGVALWGGLLLLRKKALPEQRRFLWAATLAAPLGLLAVEAGWMVTEVGRQPWIIHGVMRTKDAVTPMPNVQISLLVTCLVYLVLGTVVALLLRRYVAGSS